MKNIYICFLMMLCCSSTLETNAYIVTGMVIDSINKQPIKAALVTIENTKMYTHSNEKGIFTFKSVEKQKVTLNIVCNGYHSESINLELPNEIVVLVELCPDEVHLDGFTLQAKHNDAGPSKIELKLPEIDRLRGQNFGDMIKNIPGIATINSGPGISKPVIRGLTGSRLVTVYNEIRQEGQQWGIEHAPEIDPISIGGIEVIKGAGAVEYGADAIAGIIKIMPIKYRMIEGTESTIYTDGNSNNRLIGGGFALNSHIKNNSWRMLAGYKKAGDAHAPSYNLSNTGYENFSIQTGLKTGSSSNYLEVNYSLYQSKNAMLRASHFGNITDLLNAINSNTPLFIKPFTYSISKPYQKAMHQLLSVKWSKSMKKGRRHILQLATQYNLRHEYDPDKVYNPSLSQLDLAAFSLGISTTSLESKWELPITSTFKINAGLNYMFQYNHAWGKRYLIPNFKSHLLGLYAVALYKQKSYSAELGFRVDRRQIKSDAVRNFVQLNENKTYSGITSILSVSKEFFKYIDLSFSSSTGWRAPNVSELYSNGLHGATGNFEIGNQYLETEKSWNNEITLKLHKQKLTMETNLYANQIANYIYMEPDKNPTLTIQGAFPTMRYKSANVLMKGAESKWVIQQKKWQFELSGMYLSTLNKATKQALWMIPSNRIRAEISYMPKDKKRFTNNRIELTYSHIFKQTHLPPNIDYAVAPDAYDLIQFKFETTILFRRQPLKLFFTINNLLNKSYRDYLYRYRYYANEQGRDFQINIQIPINNFSKHIHNN